ncbi:hypothetical protein WSS15_12100 [Acetobacter pasteurianus]|uniref:DUF72 domain-containing protein n=1 Tax=Acetobacter pasteurianus NBRC 3278 TaxID=1226660 RepID=A0A401X2Z0_ACEPA|nr:DUF72 domain-containing protein [Acetobacter pasteurianus]BAU38389.1 hypothetical protein APT_01307 [Acetobacter pasteurianus NBRC 101655]CCT58286.1 hypothetical protein APA386B_165 [Acetobacter pasteurianus 386B]GCD58685.1 hypothetical protein NBRC3277_1260 [Acetobacter pasteurianus NBRC 3277]GCD62176.1 hypothetical protein NBRC3278_1269 [Acetobacter pasteurianus NBRC 3278]GCD68552.1 hypothetical protein NBRC3280_1187 [Acetobacter pasteurianus NBRC 3280]
MPVRIGVAGWSVPTQLAAEFPSTGTHLERYGTRFSAVEINSSFYRPHQHKTYVRWAASVPPDFRFSVKLPKIITHEQRFIGCQDLVARFAAETSGLGDKRGPILVQLPPSFAYPGDIAEQFLHDLKVAINGPVVLEPRHMSWFQPEVDLMLKRQHVSRVAADPARFTSALQPGGWGGLVYFRLHGSPRIYESPYSAEAVQAHANSVAALSACGTDVWTIYDNTTFGAATQNALELIAALQALKHSPSTITD